MSARGDALRSQAHLAREMEASRRGFPEGFESAERFAAVAQHLEGMAELADAIDELASKLDR